jgi:hypothetical protein
LEAAVLRCDFRFPSPISQSLHARSGASVDSGACGSVPLGAAAGLDDEGVSF